MRAVLTSLLLVMAAPAVSARAEPAAEAPSAGQDATAPADCPDPADRVPRGLTLRSALGPAVWLGAVGADSRPGLAFTFAAGWELWDFLAIEAAYRAGFHETDQPHPPAAGAFTTHALHGGLRLGWTLERFDLFARGGIGVQWSAPDILVRVENFDGRSRLSWLGGLGMTWHTPRRRFWIGIETDAMGGVGFPGVLLTVAGVVGCTLLYY